MKVNECKILDAVSCEKNASVIDVAKLMKEKAQRHVIVTENGKPVGIISPVDIVNKVVADGKDSANITAEAVMSKPIETVDVEDDLSKAYFKMASRNTFSCPVTENGKLKGIVVLNDVVKNLMSQQEDSQ